MAYASPDMPTRTARDTEYEILARVTHRMTTAKERGTHPDLVNALHENRRLWLTLGTDVADPGNALPAQLRARLFYLYEFTETHTRKVLTGDASIDVLVEINTSIMRGLRGEVSSP